jgi:UDP-glucose 4-epimerase
MKNSRILITGGAGFIGSNLADELAVNNTVTILDDLSTGKIENTAGLIDNKNVTLIKGSVLDRQLLEKILKDIDFVFHYAAVPYGSDISDDFMLSREVNINGTLNVLIAAKYNKVKKLIFASSSSVYGDAAKLPMTEDMIPNSPSPHALSKLIGEYYCNIFHLQYGIPTICLRYFNVYGPRQNTNSGYADIIPILIYSTLQGKYPVILGDGKQTLDFIYVRDAVQASIIAAESEATGVLNIGSGNKTTIKELAEYIVMISGKESEPTYQEFRVGDISECLSDITLARSFGYVPRYNLEGGLRVTIRRFVNGN